MRNASGTPFGEKSQLSVAVGEIQPGQLPSGEIDQRFVRAYNRNGGKPSVGRPLDYVRIYDEHGHSGHIQEYDEGGGGRGHLAAERTSGEVFWVHGAIYAHYDGNIHQALLQDPYFNVLYFAIGDEEEAPRSFKGHGGRQNRFQDGIILHHPGGNFEVHGPIFGVYTKEGGPGGWLGHAVSDQYTGPNGQPRSDFEGGYITREHSSAQFRAYGPDGTPVTPAEWAATYAYQTPYPTVTRGRAGRVIIGIKNIGTQTWTKSGTNQVCLGTGWDDITNPEDRHCRDRFFEPEFLRGDLIETDHESGWKPGDPNRVEMVQDEVPPGSHAYFDFWFTVPADRANGTYPIYFQPVADGAVGWFARELRIYVDITVSGDPEHWEAKTLRQSPQELTLYAGQSLEGDNGLWVEYRNMGSQVWQKDGQPFVALEAVNTASRQFYDPRWWPNREDHARASYNQATTALNAPPPVDPGQIGKFSFNITAPMTPGVYEIEFRPIADSDGVPFKGDCLVRWKVTVLADTTPPAITAVSFDPASPSGAWTVNIRVTATDRETGVDWLEVNVYAATDGSDTGLKHTLTTLFTAGRVEDFTVTVPWDTALGNYGDGVHRIDFQLQDRAGNMVSFGKHFVHYTLRRVHTPTNLTATVQSHSQVRLRWKHYSGPEEDSREGYRIERKVGAGQFNEVAVVGSADLTYLDNALQPNSSFLYRIRAYNSKFVSDYSNPALVRLGSPLAPTGLTATAHDKQRIDLRWKDNSDESGYKIERKIGTGNFTEIKVLGANVTSFSDTGLSPATLHTYRLRAYNPIGNSPYSSSAQATTLPLPPAAPTNLMVTTPAAPGGRTGLRLAWTDNANTETGFKVFRKTGTEAFVEIKRLGVNAVSFTDTNLAPSTRYLYFVRAFNTGGDSGNSSNAAGTTLPLPPAAPSGLVVSVLPLPEGQTQLKLTWTDNAGNEVGFKVFRKTGTQPFAEIKPLGANITSFTDTNLAPNTRYLYYVMAYNAGGSANSANAAATTLP